MKYSREIVEALTNVFMCGFRLGRNDILFPVDKHTFQSILKGTLEVALEIVSSKKESS